MASTHDASSRPNFEMLHKAPKNPLLPGSPAGPPSDTTEIFDTDFDSDYNDEFESSRRTSAGSLVADSVTTASTPREVPTPDSAGALSSFHFHFDDGRPIMGPNGPHLFRSSVSSEEYKSIYEVDLFLAKTPTTAVFDRRPPSVLSPERPQSPPTPTADQSSTSDLGRKDTPLPEHVSETETPSQTQLRSINAAVSALDETEVRSWSPPDVVRWMQDAGFDDGVIEKFFINDISGTILLELQPDDLKELDIQSFGKRRHLMNSIQHLRDSVMISTTDVQTPLACSSQGRDTATPESSSSSDCTLSGTDKERKKDKKHRRHRQHRAHKERIPTIRDFNVDDAASIIAIEQFLPRPHRCSKGEECRKWQKQQRKIVRLAKDLPIEIDVSAASQLSSDQGQCNPPQTAKSFPGTDPMPTPSIVASSDVLGPEQAPSNFHLCEEKLNGFRQRDPQETVRQFLTFQHLSPLQTVNDLLLPRTEGYPSPDVDSPDSTKTTDSLSENLRTLPRLTIPINQSLVVPGSYSASLSAQRTVTPSILRRRPNFSTASIDSTLNAANTHPDSYGQIISPVDYYGSPSDFYRTHELYQQTSPLSEVDVPVTAIPAGPIERIISQSVPPDMRFGHSLATMVDPIPRPASTKAENHRGLMSYNRPTIQVLGQVEERMAPIDTVEDLISTPKASARSPSDIVQRGWMKKRKTTRLLRHEWENHHFTLKGTQLAMYEDEHTSSRDSKALEYIDVDDYAVACSSLASSSKLTAAFKKTVLKRRSAAQGEAAFAFSLIPAPNGNQAAAERKAFFSNSPKSHHFAVKSRDERIDWMRELMLAKALKKGKESGDSVHLNGQMF